MPIDDPWLGEDPSARQAAAEVLVWRFDADRGEYEAMPHLECLAVERSEGAAPSHATFRYRLDPRFGGPTSAEEALSTASIAPGLVSPGDRLAVFATTPGGSRDEDEPLFDGTVLGFDLRLGRRVEDVPITAVGIEARCRDTPIPGALLRQADQPTAAGADVQTDLVAQFNPKGKANASPLDADSGDAPWTYPTFLDPAIAYSDPGSVQRLWTLPMAVRYLLQQCNGDEAFVRNPAGDPAEAIDGLLVAREPRAGVAYDPEDPATYDTADLVCPDSPITGRDWPTVLRHLIGEKGFGMAWRIGWGADTQETTLDLYHPQRGEPVDLWLQPRGEALDVTLSNVADARLGRDVAGVVNSWSVEGAVKRYEVSLVLACGFPCASGDAVAANLLGFNRNALGTFNYNAYRLYIFDECGEGHYVPGSVVPDTTVVNLDGLFGSGRWARRRRRAIGELFTRDSAGKPLKARLAISTDYTGASPGLWDGTGTWQQVAGGYELLKDRLGVRVSGDNPNAWHVGKSDVSGHPFRDGVVKGVEAQATLVSGKSFYLRLTCVVEGDKVVSYQAARSGRSPLPYQVTRRVDARDRYRLQTIAAKSEFNTTSTPVIDRDDTDACQAEATAMQAATEAGVLDGEVVIPYLTLQYEVGDRVRGINGRNLGLRTDGGSDSDGAAVYPNIAAIRWELSPRQRTVLTLSDASTLRHYLKGKWRGVPADDSAQAAQF